MNEIDRKIAEKLGYKATIDPTRMGWVIVNPKGDHTTYQCYETEELAWQVFYNHVGKWSWDVDAALRLARELELPFQLNYSTEVGYWCSGLEDYSTSAAEAVAAAILAWLEAQEAER